MTLLEIQKEIIKTIEEVSDENAASILRADKIGYIRGLVWVLSGKQQDIKSKNFHITEWLKWSRIPYSETDGEVKIDPEWREKNLKNF